MNLWRRWTITGLTGLIVGIAMGIYIQSDLRHRGDAHGFADVWPLASLFGLISALLVMAILHVG